MKAIRLFLCLGLLAEFGCTSGTEDPRFDNPLDPIVDPGLPRPESLVLLVGDNVVKLSWQLPDGETADAFAVYRGRIDAAGTELEATRRLATVSALTYDDTDVRNGRIYVYSVAAGRNDRLGTPCEEIEACPAPFGIVVGAGAEATRTREVSISCNVPSTTTSVQLSEDATFRGCSWRPLAEGTRWTLSAGDGPKTVHARFQMEGGAASLPVSGAIRLDTRAVILSADFDGASVRASGETIHFRVDTGEAGGICRIDLSGIFTTLDLFDDGAGDGAAADGIYERDVVIPEGAVATQATLTARFADGLGNQAAAMEGARKLTVQHPPQPVELLAPEVSRPPDAASVTLRWTPNSDADFAAYRVRRAEGALPAVILSSLTDPLTMSYVDRAVAEGSTYTYSMEVVTKTGLTAVSGPLVVEVPNLRPPASVTLQSAEASSTSRLALKWGRSQDRDFAFYRLYRNTGGAVSDADPLLVEVRDADATFFDDTGLEENTAYCYRVYVGDRGGLTSRSNEVEGRTRNEPPPAVTLNGAQSVGSTALTLSWSVSGAHDFAHYRIYRSEAPGVSAASEMVAEIDEIAITTCRDTGLSPGTTYHYRVYVVDDGTNPGPESTGSNEMVVTTTLSE